MKLWWQGFKQSLTVKFNILLAVVVLPLVEFLPELTAQLPVLKGYLPDDLYKWLFIFTIVVNGLLRVYKTKSPIQA